MIKAMMEKRSRESSVGGGCNGNSSGVVGGQQVGFLGPVTVSTEEGGAVIKLAGLELVQLSGNHKPLSQRLIGEGGERVYLAPEGKSVRLSLDGIMHHFADGQLLRRRFFGSQVAEYRVESGNGLQLQGRFVIVHYELEAKDGGLPRISLQLQSDGAVEYEEGRGIVRPALLGRRTPPSLSSGER